MKRFHVTTFGCQMNVHDSERMHEVLRGSGYVEAEREEDADLIVLNTCSVREKAEQKLRSLVGTLAERKRERPELVIAVAGCLAQQEGGINETLRLAHSLLDNAHFLLCCLAIFA